MVMPLPIRAAAIFDIELPILNFIPFKILDNWRFAMRLLFFRLSETGRKKIK